MTLPTSGSLTTTTLNLEMQLSGSASITFPNAATLYLAGKASGSVVMPNDFWGQTWGPGPSNHTRFGALASPGSQWTIPSGAPFAVGDLCIVSQYVENTTATTPAQLIPSGWTQLTGDVIGTTADGHGFRANFIYRIITAGQLGSTVTGMTGAARNRVCGILLHFDDAVTSLHQIDDGLSQSTGVPGSQVITWDSIRDGSHLLVSVAHGETSIADADMTWSADTPSAGSTNETANKGDPSVTRVYYRIYDNNVDIPPASVTIALPGDNGTFNVLGAALVRLFRD
jgi:hypothetical protein